jgi:nicotinamide-nucleotide amidase
MRIECIAIGTELLTTTRVDTNSVWLAQRLAGLGLAFHRKTAVGDHREDLRDLFAEALNRSDLILCTGGLGPTFDDFTKEVLAEVLGVPLVEDLHVRHDIEHFYEILNRPMPLTNLKQALVPMGAEALRNPLGTAPGIFWENPQGHPGRRIVLLPGVPREMKHLWEHDLEPRIRLLSGKQIHTLRMLVGSVGESALEVRTTPLREKHGHLDWTILASLGQVELIARSTDPEALEAARKDFEEELGEDLVCVGRASIEETLLELLKARHETLTLAESMTGGLIASRLTAVPGASETFIGGAVVYTAKAKECLADVPPSILHDHGTVSEPTTRALAEGIRRKLGATWSLAVTGNAGPTEDPAGSAAIGTCYIAVAGPAGTFAQSLNFPGERTAVQARTASWALDFLRRKMTGKKM